MPLPAHAWWHLILSGHSTWLPGDPRGFRSRAHRVHSSGDYKNLPPQDEHQGLRCYNQDHANSPRPFHLDHRKLLGQAMLARLKQTKKRCLAIAVGVSHAHLLAECEDDYKKIRQFVGLLKQVSSFAVRDVLPGQIWADGGRPVRIRDHKHQEQVFYYILDHARKEAAWIWRFDQDPDLYWK